MKERLIEFGILAVIIAVFMGGLFSGVAVGIAAAILKTIYNKLVGPEKALPSPFSSVGIGALAGLAVTVVKWII
ncbi:MAG: hypothetical protein LPJ98_08175 [Cyclobacteriaceae bacterium]|nr:hypothetical protein [Cyclobacteriaceae bacterium]